MHQHRQVTMKEPAFSFVDTFFNSLLTLDYAVYQYNVTQVLENIGGLFT